MNIKDNILQTIGKTPLVRLNQISKHASAELIVKCEFFNPGSSIKDRTALALLEDAEQQNKIHPGYTIIEPTSGNTGIGLALVCAIKGYSLVLTMPESMSNERKNLLQALGAELILTPAESGMNGAIEKAEQLYKERKPAFIPQQFKNPANPNIHYKTTAQEIWDDTDGSFDALVAGIGTGGTLTGIFQFLKEKNKSIHLVGIEPASSPVLSGGKPHPHTIQGIGTGFIPEILDVSAPNEIIPITNDEANSYTQRLAKEEGIFAGISSGAAVAGAVKLGSRPDFQNKRIIIILPDTGERYLSSNVWR